MAPTVGQHTARTDHPSQVRKVAAVMIGAVALVAVDTVAETQLAHYQTRYSVWWSGRQAVRRRLIRRGRYGRGVIRRM
jgi:hypothetical protein